MANLLLIDFGSTYTKVTAVDVEQEVILGTASAMTTVTTDITDGLDRALATLADKIGARSYAKTLACSSAAGGLKMVAIGLVPELTAEAAKRAALGAGAKVLGVFCHELSELEMAEIATLAPEIILLAGGTDGGNKEVLLHNAAMLAQMPKPVPIIVAGNKVVAGKAASLLASAGKEAIVTENVMPRLNELHIEPARHAIREVFLRRIVEAKGLNKARRLVDEVVEPTPAAVLKAAELLALGTEREPGIGELMMVDIGGATTDVYSIASGAPTHEYVQQKGLPEPFAKRTVEGDLGMRYSAGSLVHAAGLTRLAKAAGVGEADVARYLAVIEAQVDYLPQTAAEEAIERELGCACTRLAVERHVGRVETVYTTMGSMMLQTGKDLTGIKTVIGTGGVIIGSAEPEGMLAGVLADEAQPGLLKPKAPRLLVDKEYILAAMGLLGDVYPDVAVRMMKRIIAGGNAHGTKK